MMAEPARGHFITLEGGEGAGKTTALAAVVDWLRAAGREVVTTREPGGTPAAERIREVLLDPETGDLDPMTELLLMFAARRENVQQVIAPALAAGRDVVCDRFTDASYAYQGGGRGLGPAPVERLAELVHPDLQPDLVILLDLPVGDGLARIAGRGGAPDRFERDRGEFLQRVRQAYRERARAYPERFALIDAGRSAADVAAAIRSALEARLE